MIEYFLFISRVPRRQLMERNAVMLEETKDTITVPAAFMIRMLACIHSLRNRRPTVRGSPDGDGATSGPNDGDAQRGSSNSRRDNDDGDNEID